MFRKIFIAVSFGLLVAAPALLGSETDEAPRPLAQRGLENLVAFTRLYGVVRYFHPSTEANELDWERFAIHGVREVEAAEDAYELEDTLGELFIDIAPTVQVWAGGIEEAPEPIEVDEPATRRVGWVHVGLGPNLATPGDDSPMMSIYTSERIVEPVPGAEEPPGDTETGLAPLGTVWLRTVGGGVSCRVPVTLLANDEGTLPQGLEVPEFDTSWQPSVNDRATRLASVMIVWNIVQHFYPYLDFVKVDWPAALRDALQEAAVQGDPGEFFDTLSRFLARIRDGHGNVFPLGMAATPQWSLPILAEFVREHLYVTHVPEELGDQVRRGDEIVTIDGRPVPDLYAETAAKICYATEGWARHKAVGLMFRGNDPGPVTLGLRSPASRLSEVSLRRRGLAEVYAMKEPRPDNGEELAPGILYFNLDGTDTNELTRLLPELAKAKGIVFDLRGYPGSAGADLFPYLSDKELHSAWWNVPVYRSPDQEHVKFLRSHWTLLPAAPRLTDNRAFLTDGRAISYAESCMGIVEHYRLGEIIGARTAGTNGNVNRATLPAGFMLIWTGMKVTKHDDTPHHGVGILPTIPVERTVEGIAAGRDEVLDRAVETLRARVAK
ncbi:MAG: S41 family peptidase [Planctomycetota bacterium]